MLFCYLEYPSAMQCIGILPGIGSYISEDSSDSDKTSNSDLEDDIYDFRGHKVQKSVRIFVSDSSFSSLFYYLFLIIVFS